MGCFDTVEFRCPNCNAKVELQTKYGPCNLDTYQLNGQHPPPPGIIGSLAREKEECRNCHSTIRFAVTAFAVPFVAEDEDDEEDDY